MAILCLKFLKQNNKDINTTKRNALLELSACKGKLLCKLTTVLQVGRPTSLFDI